MYGKDVIPPSMIFDFSWDEIIIISLSAMNIIKEQLIDMGVPENKINVAYVSTKVQAREMFVRDYAKIVYQKKIQGCIAEAGVFQGEFARIMNDAFPDRRLYLFDTFEGFDERDIVYERKNHFSGSVKGHLSLTSVDMVLSKMKYRDNCVIKKGYFPDTAEGIDETFTFVNLDMDLYKPTLEGLCFFWPRMAKGGIIVVHDYFSNGYEGVNTAVDEFIEKKESIVPFPIGDDVSIALQRG